MKLEDQVCSLELAKKLKELGVKQESAFYWSRGVHFNPYELLLGGHSVFETADKEHKIAAFTVAELGELLDGEASTDLHGGAWYGYRWDDTKLSGPDVTEADCRAKMLIHLIEKGIVNPNHLNGAQEL